MTKARITAPFIVGACLFGALTAKVAQADQAQFSRRAVIATTAIGDDLLEIVSTEDIEIRGQTAIQTFGQIVLPVNEHYFDAEVVEAYTLKADGRRIAVPADKILVSTAPNAPTLGIFQADVRMRTIVFPDVGVGDTEHYVYRAREKARGIRGGLSAYWTVAPTAGFDQYSITFDAPADIDVRASVVGFIQKKLEKNGRAITRWTLAPQERHAPEDGSTSPFDRDPHVLISSYKDWSAIGESFYDAASPMSEPTPEIRTLAETIASGKSDRREQANAILDWVGRNIRYLAIFVGQGGFVPHSAASTLANKYGDCKDMATLTRALLAARGIESDYVLINSNPVHQRYEPAMPDWFNHMILFVPEFDLYADPTSAFSSFGHLTLQEADKSVLRVGKGGVDFVQTPVLSPETNRLSVVSDVSLSADGKTSGKATTTASGPIAAVLRFNAAEIAKAGGDAYANALLAKSRWTGSAHFEPHDPLDRGEPYALKSSFEFDNNFLDEDTNNNPIPVGPDLYRPAYMVIAAYNHRKNALAFVCYAETYEQTTDFHIPERMKITNLPKDKELDSTLAAFRSHYEMKGSTLHIERRFVSRVVGQVCTADMAHDMADVAEAASKDFNFRPQFAKD